MAKPLSISVKETFEELKKLLKSSSPHLSVRVKMLMVIKRSNSLLSKNDLANEIGVNHNSIQKWRRNYLQGGIKKLLADGRVGFKPSVISKSSHEQIRIKLNNPEGAITSFVDLQSWVDSTLEKGINYNTLRHYVKRHFGAKLKVARKSHINKDKQALEAFKKTSGKSARKK
jgi:transposase